MNKNHTPLIMIVIFATFKCQAFEYLLVPKFAANQRYDSNITLQQKPKHGNWVSTLSPGIDLGFRRENSEINSNFTWNQLLYNNQSELDIDEQLFNTKIKHEGENINWNLNADYKNRSSLNTEANESGILQIQLRRREFYLAPAASYAFDERNTLSLEYNYLDVSFQKRANFFNLSDYSYHTISATLSHLYTQQDRLSLIFSSTLFESPGQVVGIQATEALPASFTLRKFETQKTDQYTLSHTAQIGWQHNFSEQLIASITAGARYTEAEQITSTTGQDFNVLSLTLTPFESSIKTKSSGFGQVFNASLKKLFERGSLLFNAYQQLSPTARGNQQQTFLGITSSYDLSERWQTSLNANYTAYELPSQQQSNQSRTYYNLVPSISWKWTPEVNLQLSYTYRQLSYDTENQAREGNIAQLQFTYQPQINRQVK